jgi:hypothetical protein
MTSRQPGIPAFYRHGLLPNNVASGESNLCVGCSPEVWWRYSCRFLPDDVVPAEARLLRSFSLNVRANGKKSSSGLRGGQL